GSALSPSPTSVAFNQETGSQVVFNLNGTWVGPSWAEATLTHNGDGTWTVVRRSSQTLRFDSTGRVTSLADLNGETLAIAYPSGTSMTVGDAAGRTLTVVLNTATPPHITSISDSSSPARTVQFSYSGAGDLNDVTDIAGGHTAYAYDASHRLVTMRTPRFAGDGALPAPVSDCSTVTGPTHVTSTHYDANGRVDCQYDALGRRTRFSWVGPAGGMATQSTVTDPKGNVTVYSYVGGELVAVTKGSGTPQAATWRYSYDPVSLGLVWTQDPLGNVTTATYDARGNRLNTQDPLGRTNSATYNALDEPLTTTDGKGVTTTNTYDPSGNILTTATPLLNATGQPVLDPQSHPVVATTTYNRLGGGDTHPADVTSIVDADGATTTFTYDAAGDRTSTTPPSTSDNTEHPGVAQANTTKYGYDIQRGVLTTVLSPRATVAGATLPCTPPALGCTSIAHDVWGNVTTTTDPLGHTTTNHYDADQNLDSFTDANSKLTTYVYDAEEERTQVKRADTPQTTLVTDYNLDGTVADTVDGAGARTTYSYDPLARVTSVADPLGRATTYGYDAAGNNTSLGDPAGRTTMSAYDAARQLLSVTYSDGITPGVSGLTYDADGQRTAMTDGTGISSWGWDSLHRMTISTDGAGKSVAYGYADSSKTNGQELRYGPTNLTYPTSTALVVNRHYDGMGRMDCLVTASAVGICNPVSTTTPGQTNFAFNADSMLAASTLPSTTGVVDTNAYDNADGLASMSDAHLGTPFATFTYGRDAANQVSQVTSTGVPSDNHFYGYTPLEQLAGQGSSANPSPNFSYDAADNLTQLQRQTDAAGANYSSVTQTFDVANEALTSTVGTAKTTFGYDQRGDRWSSQPQAGQTMALGWDQANRLSYAATTPLKSANYPSTIRPSAPLAWWRLGETSGTTAADASGNGHAGTYVGSPSLSQTGAISGDTDKAVKFNGTSQSVTTSGVPDFAGAAPFSLEAWVKPATTDTGNPRILAKETSSGTHQGYLLYLHNNTVNFQRYDTAGAADTATTASAIPTTSFSHLVATYDGATMRIYVNGVLSASQASTRSMASLPGGTQLNLALGQSSRLNGTIDEAAVYDHALSTVEVASHTATGTASNPAPTYAPNVLADAPQGYWRLGETSGTTAADASGNGHTGTYVASPTLSQTGAISGDTDKAAKFNGTTQQVTTTGVSSFTGVSPFSLEAWVKPAATDASFRRILSKESGGSPNTGYRLWVHSGQVGFERQSSTVTNSLVTSSTIPTTSFTHVVATFDGATMAIYLNGALSASLKPATVASLSTTTPTFDIAQGAAGWFSGTVDEAAVYDHLLTPGRIATHYAVGSTGGNRISYAYSGDGLRVSKASGGTTNHFVWSVAGDLPQLLMDGNTSYVYDVSGNVLEQVNSSGAATAWYHHDQLGSVRALTDSTGAVVAASSFDAYGNMTSSTGSVTTPFGYAGQYTDAETSMQYLRARYYDPATGQFVTRDPIAVTTRDAYGYAWNTPLNGTDPLGLMARPDQGYGDSYLGGYSAEAVAIGKGHAYQDHIHEFPECEESEAQFISTIDATISNPTQILQLEGGRTAYVDATDGTVVIVDPSHPDLGTAFRPEASGTDLEEYLSTLDVVIEAPGSGGNMRPDGGAWEGHGGEFGARSGGAVHLEE
ncbi:MAG: hypothetical protein JO054_14040, partial [Actinobacteria bacterium]|nr:hypothetical protein [Actinomycetota bacterium]